MGIKTWLGLRCKVKTDPGPSSPPPSAPLSLPSELHALSSPQKPHWPCSLLLHAGRPHCLPPPPAARRLHLRPSARRPPSPPPHVSLRPGVRRSQAARSTETVRPLRCLKVTDFVPRKGLGGGPLPRLCCPPGCSAAPPSQTPSPRPRARGQLACPQPPAAPAGIARPLNPAARNPLPR